jgi:hypothetical protein
MLTLAFVLFAASACSVPDRSQRPDSGSEGSVRGAASDAAASQRPQTRPDRVEQAGRTDAVLRTGGALCGDNSIRGVVIGRVASQVQGCGVPEAVGVQSVAGVTLSPRATIDCPTARALKAWVDGAVKPAFADMGGGVSSLRVAAHYACRTRNNRPGGRISEHGKGKAIDISEFRMRDGSRVSVLTGWRDPGTRGAMRQVHRAACGPFGTVLGPQADRYHQDHFHFDTARHRGGSYCR